jgi:ABC-type branched-subunit amino acid transport system ATPase component
VSEEGLIISDLRVSFGGVIAVDGVTLEVSHDPMVGIVGPNGSGKSTLLNAICGVVPCKGTVTLDGQIMDFRRPGYARRHGILRTFQTPQIVPTLSCLDNVLLADPDHRGSGIAAALVARRRVWRLERARWANAVAALERVQLESSALVPAGRLTAGQRKLLELARVINGAPRVILLDEPAAGLNEFESAAFSDLLRSLHEQGIMVVIVEHKIDFLNRLCGRIVVLNLGRVIADDIPESVWRDPRVVEAYLGQ